MASTSALDCSRFQGEVDRSGVVLGKWTTVHPQLVAYLPGKPRQPRSRQGLPIRVDPVEGADGLPLDSAVTSGLSPSSRVPSSWATAASSLPSRRSPLLVGHATYSDVNRGLKTPGQF